MLTGNSMNSCSASLRTTKIKQISLGCFKRIVDYICKMNCSMYGCCQKEESCSILGECVFTHPLMEEKIPQAILCIHYAKKPGAIVNVFRRIKNRKAFNGTNEAAQRHIQEIGLNVCKNFTP